MNTIFNNPNSIRSIPVSKPEIKYIPFSAPRCKINDNKYTVVISLRQALDEGLINTEELEKLNELVPNDGGKYNVKLLKLDGYQMLTKWAENLNAKWIVLYHVKLPTRLM